MQVILGSGGIVGNEVAKSLITRTSAIRQASRKPQKVNATDELVVCDLTKLEDVIKATQGAEIAYLTVGFPYFAKIWNEKWPITMKNVIEACTINATKLIFLDNVYMYDPAHISHMTESTPFNPSSKKGKVRAVVATMMIEAIEAGKIEGLIARSADFYGLGEHYTSVIGETVVSKFKQGKSAQWFCDANKRHAYTYTPDIGAAMVRLAHESTAYNQTWHLPTDKPITGKEWIEAFAAQMDVAPKYRVLSYRMVKTLGWFVPVLKEIAETLYQYDQDYYFDSSKYEKAFEHFPTPNQTAIAAIVEELSV